MLMAGDNRGTGGLVLARLAAPDLPARGVVMPSRFMNRVSCGCLSAARSGSRQAAPTGPPDWPPANEGAGRTAERRWSGAALSRALIRPDLLDMWMCRCVLPPNVSPHVSRVVPVDSQPCPVKDLVKTPRGWVTMPDEDPYLALRRALRTGGVPRLVRRRPDAVVGIDPWRALRAPFAKGPPAAVVRRLRLVLVDGSSGDLVVRQRPFADGVVSVGSRWINAQGIESAVRPFLLPLFGGDSSSASQIVLCEGVPAAEAIQALGFAAWGTLTGPMRAPALAAMPHGKGRRVVVWPLPDDASRRHLREVAAMLWARGAEVSFVTEGVLGPHVLTASDRDTAKAAIASAVPWRPGARDALRGTAPSTANLPGGVIDG